MTTTRKLVAIVAKRFDLSDTERDELDGHTVGELSAHAEHLVARRRYVADHLKVHTTASESDLVRDYDGRRRPDAASAGRRFASTALGGHVEHDPRTSAFLARAGAAGATRRRPIEDDDARRERVTARLEAAGYTAQDNTYGHGHGERRI